MCFKNNVCLLLFKCFSLKSSWYGARIYRYFDENYFDKSREIHVGTYHNFLLGNRKIYRWWFVKCLRAPLKIERFFAPFEKLIENVIDEMVFLKMTGLLESEQLWFKSVCATFSRCSIKLSFIWLPSRMYYCFLD